MPNYESLMALLRKHPWPWKTIQESLMPGESDIADANGRPVMRIKTSVENHQSALNLFEYMMPEAMPELTQQLEHERRNAHARWLKETLTPKPKS